MQPVAQRLHLAVALGEQPGAGLDAFGEFAALCLGTAVGFAVLQRPGMFLAKANRFAQPQAMEFCLDGGGGSHAASRWLGQRVSITLDAALGKTLVRRSGSGHSG
ncbi:hypothetical protein FQZ97_779220 [compost metagenome]